MKLDIRFGECPSIYCDSDTWENRNSKFIPGCVLLVSLCFSIMF